MNGHALGRFWKIGPQKTLYVPGPWLKKGANEVVVFDVDGKPGATLEGLAKADLGSRRSCRPAPCTGSAVTFVKLVPAA